MYQTTIGAHQHRSSRGEKKLHLPKSVRTIPEILKEAGYYVTNGRYVKPGDAELDVGKTDYNFVYDDDLYNGRALLQHARRMRRDDREERD